MSNVYINDFNNTVNNYYNNLKSLSLISKERERELLLKAKEGNLNARNELAQSHLRFVFDVAKKYTGHGVAMEDLIAEGNLGLMKAIEKYDLTQDVKFISYAVHWIKYYIRDIIKKRYFISQNENTDEYLNTSPHITQEDSDDDDVILMENQNTVIIDEEISKLFSSNRLLMNLVDNLSPRGRDILVMYYGLNGDEPMTLDEIGTQLHISRERVRQIKVQTLRELRTTILSSKELVETLRN